MYTGPSIPPFRLHSLVGVCPNSSGLVKMFAKFVRQRWENIGFGLVNFKSVSHRLLVHTVVALECCPVTGDCFETGDSLGTVVTPENGWTVSCRDWTILDCTHHPASTGYQYRPPRRRGERCTGPPGRAVPISTDVTRTTGKLLYYIHRIRDVLSCSLSSTVKQLVINGLKLQYLRSIIIHPLIKRADDKRIASFALAVINF